MGSLIKDIFDPHVSEGSVAFSLFNKATKFELLSFFILLLRQSAPKIGRKSKA